MLCADLTLPVMIVLSGMALTLGFPAENIHENPFFSLVKICDFQIREENPPCPLCRSWNTRHKNKTRRYLEPIIIKLENVIGKYEEKKKELEKFYSEFSELTLPNNQEPSDFGCINFKQVKRKVSELMKKIQTTNRNLKSLIYLEKSPNLKKHEHHEGRLELLIEFGAEIKNLIVELKHNKRVKNKTRNKSLTRRMQEKAASANLSHIKSLIKLKIEEWKLLNNLKTVLEIWTRNLRKFFECTYKKS